MINYILKRQSAQPGLTKDEITETRVYAQVQSKETVSLNEFAKHMASHGSVYKRSDILAVLTQTVDCLREMLLDGKFVQFGELGTFGVSINGFGAESFPGESEDGKGDWNVSKIKALNITYRPGTSFEDLLKDASFNRVARLEDQRAAMKEQAGNTEGGNGGSGTGGGGSDEME